jgi:LacI family transcriptional regulator, repressor for deo operon, udp, cdd, tsx, nupC, and nupG
MSGLARTVARHYSCRMKRGKNAPGRAAGPATIRDVASELGMSVATVSRALSQPDLLRPETRERVLSVVAKLGYRPNVLARSLRRGQAHAIVLVVPKLSPFFLEIFAGAEEAALTAGLAVLLGNSDGKSEREEAYFDQVMSGRADGIILLTGLLPSSYAEGKRALPPLVSVLERLKGHDAPVVRIDHQAASTEVTRHLIELGHRRIAHITGSWRAASTEHRLSGYKDALSAAGIPFDSDLVADGDFSMQSGAVAMDRLLDLDNPPTGVFAGNDEMAFGAVKAARVRGLSVPEDLSMVGFDDQTTAAFYNPPLTTIHTPCREIGRRATLELIEQIAGRESTGETVLPTKLIVRDSTAAPRTTASTRLINPRLLLDR